MLATSASKLPSGNEWTYEVKWDGYRTLAVKQGARVKLLSRNATRPSAFGRLHANHGRAARLCQFDVLLQRFGVTRIRLACSGGRIAELLLEGNEKVRVLGRSTEKLAGLARRGAASLTGDAGDAGSLS